MRILLLGASGQVGWELRRSLAPVGELTAACRSNSGEKGDLLEVDALVRTIRDLRPHVIVNAAAYTAVDLAESVDQQANARMVNALAPGIIADEARDLGALFVHYSTDYVFDGTGSTPWSESDVPSPLSFYGRTKLEGESLILGSGCRCLIFRASWVYANRGRNFLRTILKAASELERLKVVNDQWGAPTGAELIADVTAHGVRAATKGPSAHGIYHLVAQGETTWHEYAMFVIQVASNLGFPIRVESSAVSGCPTSEYPTAAVRPLNSRLLTRRIQDEFGVSLPDWRAGVERVVTELVLR